VGDDPSGINTPQMMRADDDHERGGATEGSEGMAEKDEPKTPSRIPDTVQRDINESKKEKEIERPRPQPPREEK
jgi:hypothetical protein